MSFLNDFSAPIAAKKPLFLEDDAPLDSTPLKASLGVSSESKVAPENRGCTTTSSKISPPSWVTTDFVDEDTITTGNTLSSAEELHFPSSSLYHKGWDLYRLKILGKGSFGCATLYTVGRASSSSSVSGETHSLASKENSLHKYVVVKDINLQTMMAKNEQMAALKNEVAALQKICGHPNVVQLVDYHHDDGGMMAYIITEYCDGGDIAMCIEKVQHGQYIPPHSAKDKLEPTPLSSFPETVVASVLIQGVVVLHYLHMEECIVHRDIKPHNLFLLSDGITIRVGDFGVVALLDKIGDRAKTVCGSPFYIAPEVCAETPYNGEADIWSLGVVLYEMMAQSRPFTGSTTTALYQLIMKGKCVPLSERTVKSSSGKTTPLPYSKDLMELVMSMLTVDPKARPTLRRLLRSAYVRSNLHTVPKDVLSSKFYHKLFEEKEWSWAIKNCLYKATKQSSTEKASTRESEEDVYVDDFEDEEEI